MSANVNESGHGRAGAVNIRTMLDDDIGAVTGIYNEAIARHESTREFSERTAEQCGDWILTGDARFSGYVAESEDRIVGWGALTRLYPRAAYDATAELSVHVSPSRRRCGVGSALTDHILERARSLQYHLLIAFVFPEPAWLSEDIRRRGFEDCGTLPEAGIWCGSLRDVMMLALRLEGAPAESGR